MKKVLLAQMRRLYSSQASRGKLSRCTPPRYMPKAKAKRTS